MVDKVKTSSYRHMADRRLLKLYVGSCLYANESNSMLSAEGFLQAEELAKRGYRVNDLEDLQKRLEK
jgi:hypothetical protein